MTSYTKAKNRRKGQSGGEYVLRELVLVPPDQVKRSSDQTKPEYRFKKRAYRAPFQPYKNAMVEMDDTMKRILHSKGKTLDEKWPLYEEALNKFLVLKNKTARERRVPPPPPRPLPPPPPPPPLPSAIPQSPISKEMGYLDVRRGRPGNRKERARLILKRLKDAGVTWDDYQRVIYPDTGVDEKSNITDLIADVASYTTRSTTPPRGYERFYRTLRRINLPRYLVGNINREEHLDTDPSYASSDESDLEVPSYEDRDEGTDDQPSRESAGDDTSALGAVGGDDELESVAGTPFGRSYEDFRKLSERRRRMREDSGKF